jgi:hypothetical protein
MRSEREAQIPDVVGGTFLRVREHLEPFRRGFRSEGDGVEEVPPARWSPWFGYKSARLEGFQVRVNGEVIQNIVNDLLWNPWNDNGLGFHSNGTSCF